MIGEAPQAYHTGVPGWETMSEQSLLLYLTRLVPDQGQIVEVGSEYGMSASLFLYAKKKSVTLACVDIQPDWAPFKSNLTEAGLLPRPHMDLLIIPGDSKVEGRKWSTPIDLLFIDGDHTYEGCLSDIEAWVSHVKVGGRVIFHDSATWTNRNPHPLHKEVARAITEWVRREEGKWRFLLSVDTMEVFERIK